MSDWESIKTRLEKLAADLYPIDAADIRAALEEVALARSAAAAEAGHADELQAERDALRQRVEELEAANLRLQQFPRSGHAAEAALGRVEGVVAGLLAGSDLYAPVIAAIRAASPRR